MKKFIDKIKDDDQDEVELSPQAAEQDSHSQPSRGDEPRLLDSDAADTDDSDSTSDSGGMLPGMGAAPETDSSSSDDTGPDDRLDTIIKQNKRIIELLEQISGSYDDSQTGNSNDLW